MLWDGSELKAPECMSGSVVVCPIPHTDAVPNWATNDELRVCLPWSEVWLRFAARATGESNER